MTQAKAKDSRLGEVGLPAYAGGKHPVDHAAVEVDNS